MPISRRGFLGCAAGASVAGIAGAAGIMGAPSFSRAQAACILFDPDRGHPVRESVSGYASALSASNISFQRTSVQPRAFANTLIVPAAVLAGAASLAEIRAHVESGSTVLYDSGAAFLGPEEFAFHKRVIRSVFGLSLHHPVRLWDSADSLKQSPYVDYHWPLFSKIRDFSRAIPIDSGADETIAWFHDIPVAARRRIGKGNLVYLGSALGPHLLSGDREAGRWLRALCAAS